MTEQEKREKAIEEISEIIKKVYKEWGLYLPSVCGASIYDQYILRKADEVRKETAEKILRYIFENGEEWNEEEFYLFIADYIREEFGVEVEE